MSSFAIAPTDEELLSHYLYHKVVGDSTPQTNLPVIDLYNMEPSLIWERFGGIDGRDLYCFTVLKRKKSRIVRKVGSSGYTWSGESQCKQVFSSDGKTPIGSFKRFHYENPKLKVHDDISWIMFEYTLNPMIVSNGVVHDSYVLCKIRKRVVKKKLNKSGVTATSTSTSMEVNGQIPKSEDVVDLDFGFKKDEIKESLLGFSGLESSELQKGFGPQTNNHRPQIMCGTARVDESYDHISKRAKLAKENKLENQFCNYNKKVIQDEIEIDLWSDLEPIVPLEYIQFLSDSQFTKMCSLKEMELLDKTHNQNSSLMTQMELYEQNLPYAWFAYLCHELYDQSSNNVELANTSAPKQIEVLDQNLNNLELDNERNNLCNENYQNVDNLCDENDQDVDNLAYEETCETTEMESHHPTKLDVKEFAKLLLSLQDQ